MVKKLFLSLLKGIGAGAAIGVGGFLYILMTHYVPSEGGKVLGSLLFAVGLFTVCSLKLHLYTGKIGTVYEGKQELVSYISLPIMLIGNAIGAFSLGYICFAIFKDLEIMKTVESVCLLRTSLTNGYDYISLIFKSILCGVCVYMSVYSFNKCHNKIIGILGLVLFVFLFVYTGLQHCIANMFYFGFGNHINNYTFINLALCIVGNSIGPIIPALLFKNIKNS